MFRNRIAAFAALMLIAFAQTAAAQSPTALAEGIPAGVSEVTTGGAWTKGEQNGAFRAIVVMGGEKEPQANVFVQLVAFGKEAPASTIVKTLVIKEVAEKKLQNAFVNFDAETEGKVTLIITSYDAEKDADNSLYAEVTSEGVYTIVTPAKEDAGVAEKK